MQPTICKGSCNCMCPVMLITWSPPTWTPGVQQLQDFITAVFGMNAAQPTVKNWFPVSLNAREKQHQTNIWLGKWKQPAVRFASPDRTICCPPLLRDHLSQAEQLPPSAYWAEPRDQNGTWYLITSCKLPQRDAAVCRKWNLDVSLYQGQGKGK